MTLDLDEPGLARIAQRLAAVLQPGDVVFLNGDLGTGKTTFARALLQSMGEEGEVPSPSFAIVQPYGPPMLPFPVAHVDLYRIDDVEDIAELGLDDAVIDGALLIEWPERLPDGYYPDALRLTLSRTGATTRRLTIDASSSWRARWSIQ